MSRTKNAASLDTRQRILDAALDQFHLRGYNGTSVQDLMSAAGSPKGTFYNHFASKEALALEALRVYVGQIGLASLEGPTVGSPRERIENHLAHIVALGLAVFAERGCLMGNFAGEVPAHSPPVAAAVGAYLDGWVANLSTVIEEAKEAGELTTPIASTDLAELVVDAFEGGAAKAKATSSAEPLRRFERVVAQLLH
ncbi:TetR/AcrR family transcriptional regulator [Streptomyces liangshanensis]|uniref:TetR/AcrR family transcriptional regulator n=1 Tax=Streptomyces liangshanensis TaxID=2717324 RepID=A0A6G9H0W0_9ACTN|nr:TetR/AcrR family transcriptional regulator [Streptomyces liangshanensis]QIQ04145.1 TetR/AcrR family transcriptional regulator [Streptomyces liangshanensis]